MNEVIVLGYFAESYQFLVQDEIQSYHWSKEYFTLHSLVVYFIDGEGNIQHNSLCFIADDKNHNTNFVYKIQTILVDYLKENLPIVDKIFYFSDGCVEQYKNHKNFINLCHQQDFNMDAEWIFFATSHGKSPCNGVGRFVKRYVAKRSLQRPLHDQILSYRSMLDLCVREIPSITFFSVSQEDMVNVCADLEDCFAKSKTVPGTSSHHFVPKSCNKIAHKLTSEDSDFLQFDFNKLTEEIDIKKIKYFM